MSVKLEDIAKATGFSIATVSRVLAGTDYPVSPSVREKVLSVAQAMGYKPNIAARSLRSNRTNTVGIIVDDIMSPFVPPIVRGIQDCLRENGFLSLIVNSDWDPDQEQDAIRTLISRPVDGIIFVEYSHRVRSEILEKSHKPHMFVHRIFGSPIKNSVVPDDHYGATLAVRHLISLGHQRIGYINGPENWHNSRARYLGYQDELERHNIPFDPELVQPGDWEMESGYRAAQNLLALRDRPTAIFAANDLMALGAIYAIQDAHLRVPEDIAVVGYDNRDFAKIVRPRLTTVAMPVYEMGRVATESLLAQIAGEHGETEEIKVRGELVIRDTCGADEALKAREEINPRTAFRRVLLNKQPEG
ncbi:MAG: LacI family transcriptional regulator [Anaerolineae bacterium]|nr:LacI family transcriptional regulator [Anaerolineae bacterium]MDW8069880.1 LacI family DNA-binding transcriptional regulator [Anaerolineae bacterium]